MKTTQKKAAANGAAKKKTDQLSKMKSNGLQKKNDPALEEGLGKLFIDLVKDIYWAEKALIKAIPKMIKKASSEELIAALKDHLSVTDGQVKRVEKVFELLGEKAVAKKCDAMQGLMDEAEEIMKDNDKGVVRDAGIIGAAQKVEHYEIASYGTLAAFARILGHERVVSLLEETLNEEKKSGPDIDRSSRIIC